MTTYTKRFLKKILKHGLKSARGKGLALEVDTPCYVSVWVVDEDGTKMGCITKQYLASTKIKVAVP